MTYQVAAFDLDGTLLNSQGQILDSSKQAIQAARDKGIKIVLVTGRHHTAAKPYYYELGLKTPIVCCNGTYIYQPQTDEVLSGNPFSKEEALIFLDIAEKNNIHVLMYSRDAMNYERLNPHMEKFQRWVQSCPENVRPDVRQIPSHRAIVERGDIIWKFVISDPDRQLMLDTVASLSPEHYSCEWSWIDRVDVAKSGNTKGARLLELLKMWNIDPADVIAFGDNHNDTSMLTAVGMGIAMGNAEQAVKDQAARTTTSNDENGIAEVLSELVK